MSEQVQMELKSKQVFSLGRWVVDVEGDTVVIFNETRNRLTVSLSDLDHLRTITNAILGDNA